MNTLLYLIRFLLILLVTITFCQAENIAQKKIKIGVIAGYTGPWASYGEAYKQGIQMSDLSKIADIIYEDDQFMPRKTVSAVRKLIDIDKVDLLIIGDGVTTKAVAPIIKKNKIPTIAWAIADDSFKNNDYLLRFWISEEKEKQYMSKFAELIPEEKAIAIVAEHNFSSRYGKLIKSAKPNIKLEEVAYDFNAYRSLILKYQAKNYFLCLLSGHNGLVVKELAALNQKANVFACDFIESKDDINFLKGIDYSITLSGPKLEKEFLRKLNKQEDFNHFFSIATFYSIAKIAENIIKGNQPSLFQNFQNIDTFDSAFVNTKVVKTDDDYYIDNDMTYYLLKNNQLEEIGFDG